MHVARLPIAVGLALFLECGAAIAGDANEQKAAAQQTFEAGGKLYDGHHYDQALVAFRASYQIVESPNSHLMIARCLKELGRNVEAYREYDAVAREAAGQTRYESAARAAAGERDEVKGRVALLTIRVKEPLPGLAVKFGEEPVSDAELGVAEPHEPGDAVVSATADGGDAARAEVTLTAGVASEVLLDLAPPAEKTAAIVVVPPPPTRSTNFRPWAYVAGGVGVVGVATFGIFGALSGSKYSSLESSCPKGRCPPDKQGDIDSGKSFQTVANVALVLGVVGLGAGVTLFVLSRKPSGDGAARASVRLEVGLGGVAARGAF